MGFASMSTLPTDDLCELLPSTGVQSYSVRYPTICPARPVVRADGWEIKGLLLVWRRDGVTLFLRPL